MTNQNVYFKIEISLIDTKFNKSMKKEREREKNPSLNQL